MDLSPIFPAFLLNPAWPPLVTAPPRYGNVIETAKGAKGREAGERGRCSPQRERRDDILRSGGEALALVPASDSWLPGFRLTTDPFTRSRGDHDGRKGLGRVAASLSEWNAAKFIHRWRRCAQMASERGHILSGQRTVDRADSPPNFAS
jgi:general stress protein YciG